MSYNSDHSQNENRMALLKNDLLKYVYRNQLQALDNIINKDEVVEENKFLLEKKEEKKIKLNQLKKEFKKQELVLSEAINKNKKVIEEELFISNCYKQLLENRNRITNHKKGKLNCTTELESIISKISIEEQCDFENNKQLYLELKTTQQIKILINKFSTINRLY